MGKRWAWASKDTVGVDCRAPVIKIAEVIFVHMVQGVGELAVAHKARKHERGHIVEMNDVAILRGIGDGPRGMIEVLDVIENLTSQRPLFVRIEPTGLNAHG